MNQSIVRYKPQHQLHQITETPIHKHVFDKYNNLFFFFHKHVKRCELEFRWTIKAVSCGGIFTLQFYLSKNYFPDVIKILIFFVPLSKVARVNHFHRELEDQFMCSYRPGVFY
jgi:hypothetical protein